MDEKKLRTETSITHSKMASYHGSQISQWLEEVFLPLSAEWMIPMEKMHKFCFRCSAAMFRKWCKIYRYLYLVSSVQVSRDVVSPLPDYRSASCLTFQTDCFFLFFCIRHPMVSGGCWLLCVPCVRKPVWLLKFFNSQLHPAMDIFTKGWCFGKGDLPLVSLLILGYDTFLDILVPIAVTVHHIF